MPRWPALLLASAALSCTAANPDHVAGAPSPCAPETRGCIGTRPIECLAPEAVEEVASCPSAAACARGRCVPPAGAALCATDGDCPEGRVCTALVDGQTLATLALFCVPPEGITPGARACAGDRECRTNLCLRDGSAAPRVCYRACQIDLQCPVGTVCKALSATVTGIQGTIHGCIPG